MAVGVAGSEVAEYFSTVHGLAGGDDGVDGFVGAAEAVGVVDGDHGAVDEGAGEDDRAVGYGEDWVAGVGAEVDAAVAGAPGRCGFLEWA